MATTDFKVIGTGKSEAKAQNDLDARVADIGAKLTKANISSEVSVAREVYIIAGQRKTTGDVDASFSAQSQKSWDDARGKLNNVLRTLEGATLTYTRETYFKPTAQQLGCLRETPTAGRDQSSGDSLYGRL